MIFVFAMLFISMLFGCTENVRTKQFGRKMTIKLECGQKIFDATWKRGNLWYVTKPMPSTDKPEKYSFREDSSWGMLKVK